MPKKKPTGRRPRPKVPAKKSKMNRAGTPPKTRTRGQDRSGRRY